MGWRHSKTTIVVFLLPALLAGGFLLLLNNGGDYQEGNTINELQNKGLTPFTPETAYQELNQSWYDDMTPENYRDIFYNGPSGYQYLGVDYSVPSDVIITGFKMYHRELTGVGPYSLRHRVVGELGTQTLTTTIPAATGGAWVDVRWSRSNYVIDNDPSLRLETTNASSDCIKVGADTPWNGHTWWDYGAGWIIDTTYEYLISALYENIPTLYTGVAQGDVFGPNHFVDAYYVMLAGGRTYDFTLTNISGNGNIDMRLVPFTSGGLTGEAIRSTSGTTYPETMSYEPASTTTYLLLVEPASYSEPTTSYLVNYTVQVPADDSYEENDLQTTAAAINPGNYFGLLCADDDWYNISVAAGATITVDTYFTHSLGDLDLQLYSPTGLVNSSTSTSNHERVSYTAQVPGNHSIRVYRYNCLFNNYNMTISVYTPPASDDIYEENDFQYSASIMSPGNYLNLMCMDDDWYNVSVTIGYTIRADINFQNSLGDLNLLLYYKATWYNLSNSPSADHEVVSFVAFESGFWSIRVFKGVGIPNNRYNLTITLFPPSQDDTYEDNDIQSQAWPISPGTYNSLICGDDDWFNVNVLAGSTIYVDIYFSDAIADLDLRLFNATGVECNSSIGVTDHEAVSYKAQITLTFSIRIYRFNSLESPNNYNMIVVVSEPDDGYEENDVQGQAIHIPSTPYLNATLISRHGDDDWFYVWVPAGYTVEAEITFNPGTMNLDLYLYNSIGTQINSSISENHAIETVSLKVTTPGYYYIKVYHYSGSVNSYTLDITIAQTVGDDGFEENDSFSSAALVDPGDYASLLCANDDWYYLSGYAGGVISVNISFTNSIADLDLKLFTAGGLLINSSLSASNNYEDVSFVVNVTGSYYFLVYRYSGAMSSRYNLTVSSVGGDDIYEENDFSDAAKEILAGSYSSLMCTDNDWYKIWVDQWVNITVTIAFSNTRGDLDLTLYYDNVLKAHSVGPGPDVESFTYTTLTAGYFFIKVFKGSGSFGYNPYTMNVYLGVKGTSPPGTTDTGSIAGFDVFLLIGATVASIVVLARKKIKRTD